MIPNKEIRLKYAFFYTRLPHDSNGRVCGGSKELENKTFLLYFDITRCLSVKATITGCPTPQVCVEKCPESNAYKSVAKIDDSFCDPFNKTLCPDYLIKSKPLVSLYMYLNI